MDEDARASLIYIMEGLGLNYPLKKSKEYFTKKKTNKKKALEHPKEINVSMSMPPIV